MENQNKEGPKPKFIRSLGSYALGNNHSHLSQPSSMSQSPAASNANFVPGSTASPSGTPASNYRVAQACDRCRSKKTRCDGRRPQCSQCAAVGFECKISDKLSRKAFPRGYTETLEERVRELEAENRRLAGLCDLKDEQMQLLSKFSSSSGGPTEPSVNEDDQLLQHLSSSNGGSLRVSSTNVYLLNKMASRESAQPQGPRCNGVGCNLSAHAHLHEKPVSTTLQDPTSISFEQHEAPGLPTAKALSSMANHEQSVQLATLVALSVPRSTEEILFTPQLLARIGQVHGLASKQCIYAASLLASLKESAETMIPTNDIFTELRTKSLWEMDDPMLFFTNACKFDFNIQASAGMLSLQEIDELVGVYFSKCHPVISILNENEFFSYYEKFKQNLSEGKHFFRSDDSSFSQRNKSISYKIFACILIMVCQLGLMTKIKEQQLSSTSKFVRFMTHYNHVLSVLRLNPYFSVTTTSIHSLQFMSLQLFYALNVGSVSSVYELRGKIVSMAQQLRLHRCPSAVLGTDGSTMSKSEQAERRILFWGIYYLDVFASLQLGVPRLLKDHEIECALPFGENDSQTREFSTGGFRLEGEVSQLSLALIRFSKVVGNVVDSIFKRGMTPSVVVQVALIHENALDNWRRNLPEQLRFELDVNGTINLEEMSRKKNWNEQLNKDNLRESKILMVLYFMLKCIVHLPVLATKPLLNEEPKPNADISQGRKRGTNTPDNAERSSSSYVLLQQATTTLLYVLASIKTVYLPLAVNIPRIKCRFALLNVKGILEYTKGGVLFQDNKALLMNLIKELELEKTLELPGCISWHSLILLDMTMLLLLQQPQKDAKKLDELLQRRLNYYNKLMGRPTTTIPQKRKNEDNNEFVEAPKLTPVSSDSVSPHEKRIKTEGDSESHMHMPHCDTHDGTVGHSRQKTGAQRPTHNFLAEAFNLDSVLTSNPFSNGDLSTFFNTENTNTNVGTGGASAPNFGANDPFAANSLMSDGLFRVPSNGDFLKDYYHMPEGASTSQLNLAFSNQNAAAGGSGNLRTQPTVKQNSLPVAGFAVDASLGLAPLLAWSPEADAHAFKSTTHAERLLRDQFEQPQAGGNTTKPSSHDPYAEGDQNSLFGNYDDNALVMPTRSHRGPRRRWHSTSGAAAITPQSERSKPSQNKTSSDDSTLQDLYSWQNAGF
ncbi:LAMI_0G01332g1_1 [Lachancea mirantina]|uniref:LAMI_0G01332g1_1 n=1 Tax=Lachancea mirantina TaxID=1230905 RepID=A0A1G4K7G0_9SACH|nr:LAMI_0G01332g1_1 [Lachancea mirantina]